MICPCPRSTIPGTTIRVIANKAFILVSITISHSSRFPSNSLSTPITRPALFTNTSIRFHSSGKEASAMVAAFRSRTSNGNRQIRTPYLASSSTFNSSCFATLRAFRIKSEPCEANLRAHPSPMPLLAPVIKTILPFISSYTNLDYLYNERQKYA